MKLLLLSFSLFFYLELHSQLGNYDHNGEIKIVGQRSWIKIDNSPVLVAPQTESAALLGVLLAPLIDVGVSVVKEKSKQNVLKYANTFATSVSGSNFWVDSKQVNLPILTINRDVIKLDNFQKETALKIKLIPELSPDNTAFRFVFDNASFLYNYSGAKTKKRYNYIDIKLDILFKTLTLTNGQYEIKELRATNITIPMVQVGNPKSVESLKINSGWIPLVPIPSLSIETTTTEKEIKSVKNIGKKESKKFEDSLQTTTLTQKFKNPTKKRIIKNTGLYEIEITINEFNPYKVKSENIQKLIEASSESSTTLLKTVIESFAKKEDE